ncbi:MAG TPA: NADPH-dependent oxidoreductase [Bacteroidetes bacterium]|nr:NADPH-dependent oxidoreductase [Bacteroidota bacterium]
MKKILAFGASSSRNSINKKLATWAAGQQSTASVTLIDLNDFEMPIFSIDKEQENGIPEAAQKFKALVDSHDGILVSLAEHNGAYSAAFKNIFDWISRMEGKAWSDKPMFLLATSPGGRGGSSVLEMAVNRFPFNGGKVAASFSLPSFGNNFSEGKGIVDEGLKSMFQGQLHLFLEEI